MLRICSTLSSLAST